MINNAPGWTETITILHDEVRAEAVMAETERDRAVLLFFQAWLEGELATLGAGASPVSAPPIPPGEDCCGNDPHLRPRMLQESAVGNQ